MTYFYSGIDEHSIDSNGSALISGLLERFRLSYDAIIIDSFLSKPTIPNLVLANLSTSLILVSTPHTHKVQLKTTLHDIQKSNIQSVIHLYNEASMNDPEAARHLSNLDNPDLLGGAAQNTLNFQLSEGTIVSNEVLHRNHRRNSSPYLIRIRLHENSGETTIEMPDGALTRTTISSDDSNQKLIARGTVNSVESNTYLMVTEYLSPKDPAEFIARLDKL